MGSRIVFFEKEFINAIQTRTKLDCPDSEGRAETRESVSDENGGSRLGNRDEALESTADVTLLAAHNKVALGLKCIGK